MVVNYIANTMTVTYRSIMGKNVRHVMSKYNISHHELLYMPMRVIKHKYKEIWNINVNATYYDNANIICELVEMKECNNDAVLVLIMKTQPWEDASANSYNLGVGVSIS